MFDFTDLAGDFYSPQIQIYANSYINTATKHLVKDLTDSNSIPLPDNSQKYYISPDIILSFFPHISKDNQHRLIKLYLGGEIKGTPNEMTHNHLIEKFSAFNFHFSLVANDIITSSCQTTTSNNDIFQTFSEEEEEGENERNKYLGYPFTDQTGQNKFFGNFWANKAFKFDFSCFWPEYWNKIRIWWSPRADSENFINEGSVIEIFFRYSADTNFNFNLENSKTIEIKNPYVFRIKLIGNILDNREIKIFPIAWQTLKIDSLLPKLLKNTKLINQFFTITTQSMNLPTAADPRKYWYDVFRSFEHNLFAIDWEHFRKDVNFFASIPETILTSELIPDLIFNLGQIIKIEPTPPAVVYTTYDNLGRNENDSEQNIPRNSINLKVKVNKRIFHFIANQGYFFNSENQIWIKNYQTNSILLGNPKIPNQKIRLQTRIKIQGIWNITLWMTSTVKVKNRFFQEINFQENDFKNNLKNRQTHSISDQEIYWIFSYLFVQKLAAIEWTSLAKFDWLPVEKIRIFKN